MRSYSGRFLLGLLIPILILGLVTSCERWDPVMSDRDPSVTSINGRISAVDSSGFPMVKAYASITDQDNNPVTDFEIGNFNISESGEPGIVHNIQEARIPLYVILILDRSGSMYPSYGSTGTTDLNNAVKDFFKNLDFSRTYVEIIDFGTSVVISQEFTQNENDLISTIDSKESESTKMGGTALYDAIGRGIDEANTVTMGARLLIAMTDGGENLSTRFTSVTSVINHANDHDQPVNTIVYGTFWIDPDMQMIASQTGGTYGQASTGAELSQLYVDLVPGEDHVQIDFRSRVSGTRKLTVYLTYGKLEYKFSKTYSP